MTDAELLAQMNNSLIILVIALVVIMVLGFALVLFDKNRTHKTQLEYGYNALPPVWQSLLRALVLKAADATDYLGNITDGVIGNDKPVVPPPVNQSTTLGMPIAKFSDGRIVYDDGRRSEIRIPPVDGETGVG